MNFPMKFQTAVETIISLYAVPPPTRTRNHGQRDATRRFSLRQLLNPRRYAILLSEQRDGRRAKEEEEEREREREKRAENRRVDRGDRSMGVVSGHGYRSPRPR